VLASGVANSRDAFLPNPCDVDFDSLEGGAARTCGRCDRTVHDLTALDDDDVDRLFERAEHDRVCVRARVDPRGGILRRGRLAVLAPLALVACGSNHAVGQVVREPPPDSGTAETLEVGKIAWRDPTATASASSSPTGTPRAWDIEKGAARLHIVDTPGTIVDSTAAPPLPGQALPQHPFLSGACMGDPIGCSEAGNVLRESTSTDDFIARLRKAGFTVKPTPP